MEISSKLFRKAMQGENFHDNEMFEFDSYTAFFVKLICWNLDTSLYHFIEIMQMYSQHLWQKLRKLILFYYKNSVNSTHHMFELVSRIFSTHIRIALCAQCGNYGNLLSHLFDKNFVKVFNVFTKVYNKELIWRNILWVTVNFSFFHLVEITEIHCHTYLTKISWK